MTKFIIPLFILCLIGVALRILILFKKGAHKVKKVSQAITAKPKAVKEPEKKQTPINYSQSYQAKYLLTKNEWHEYRKLIKYAEERNLTVCPKVRLLDIVEPRKGDTYMACLGKIQSKHVDFVICDQNMRIKGIIELDDNSHDQQSRQERDAFVDQVLQSVGYTVIHTRSVTETTLDVIAKVEKSIETVIEN